MDVLKTTAKGIAWTTASTIVKSVVSLVQVSILTRFLVKGDFGLVAIANLFIGFTQIFVEMGLSAGIMHRNDTTREQYSSLFWLNVFTGALLTGILCLIAPLVANAYNEPELARVLIMLSFCIFFSSLGIQHRIVQQKHMRFKSIALVEISTALLSLVLAIVLAVKGAGVYSLVYSSLFHSLSAGLLFLAIGLIKDNNISFHFRLSDTYDYLKIGVYSMGSQILDYFSRESDTLIISATLGKETVGVYSLCKKLVLSVYNSVNPIFNRVLTPVIAALQEDKQRVKNLYLTITETLALMNMPVYCLIAIFAAGILNCIYGAQYLDGAIVLMFLSLSYGVNAPASLTGPLQTATGRTDLGFYWTFCRVALTIVTVFLGSRYGINAIAVALFVLTLLTNPVIWRITIKPIINCSYWEYLSRSVVIGLIIIAYSAPFYFLFGQWMNVPACLGIGVGYTVLFVALVYLLFPSSYPVKLAKEKLGLNKAD